MAIKIKKKDPSKDAAPQAEEEQPDATVAATAAQLSDDADPFLRASWETASWIDKNRTMVVGLVLAVLIALIGGYIGLSFLESQKVEASSALTPAFDSYNTMLEGSRELEAIKSNPDLKAPTKTFKTEDERWQAIYDGATAALAKHPSAEVALAAKLSKASAGAKLGKHDEAIALYKEYLAASTDAAMKLAATQGLATAYASAEKWDDALATLDQIATMNEDLAEEVKVQKAGVLEHSGKTAEAKKLLHEVLEKDPNHPSKTDIERRLANM